MKSRRLANEKFRRLHMSGVQLPISVKLTKPSLLLSTILIKRKEEDSKIEMKTVCNVAKITGRHLWISLDVTALIHQKTKSKREYYNMKNPVGRSEQPTSKRYQKKQQK